MKSFRKLGILQSPSCTPSTDPPPFPTPTINGTASHGHPQNLTNTNNKTNVSNSFNRQKTHQRSLSDAPVMKNNFSLIENNLSMKNGHRRVGSFGLPRNCLGDLTSGHGFDNGCMCFEPIFNDLKPIDEDCACGVQRIIGMKI
jgi:hypothetical protein